MTLLVSYRFIWWILDSYWSIVPAPIWFSSLVKANRRVAVKLIIFSRISNIHSIAHWVATPTFPGVHSIFMEKSAQTGEIGMCTPTPFHCIYHHIQNCGLQAPTQRADTLPVFLLYPYMYFVILPVHRTPLEWSWETFSFSNWRCYRDLLRSQNFSNTHIFTFIVGKYRKYNYSLSENHFISLKPAEVLI